MADQPAGCARVTGGVLGGESPDPPAPTETSAKTEERRMVAQVGHKAPDFTAPAFYQGGFTNVQLSDHFGKWLLLCFYPGDFTFV